MFELQFNGNNDITLFEIAARVCKKQWICQLLQKNSRKMSMIDMDFHVKKS